MSVLSPDARVATPRRLSFFLTVILFVSALVPLLIGGFVITWLSSSALYQSQRESHFQVARATGLEINNYIDDLQRKMNFLARVPGFAELPASTQQTFVTALKRQNRAFETVAVIELGGMERLHLGPDEYEIHPTGERSDFARAQFYRDTALRGQNYIGSAHVDPGFGLFEGDVLPPEPPVGAAPFPAVTLAVPLRDSRDTLAGTLAAKVNLSFLGRVLSQNIEDPTKGTMYVLDPLGLVLARSYSNPLTLLDEQAGAPERVRTAVSAGEQSIRYENDGFVGVTFPIEGTGWTLVFEQPAAIVDAAANRTRTALLLTVLGSFVLAGLIAAYARRRIADPLNRLTAAVGGLAGGNLDVRTSIHTRDELQLLGDTFNNMADRLRDLLTTLEARVARRTSQLQTAAEVSRASSSLRSLDDLLNETVELIRDRFGFYHAQVFLVDILSDRAVLRASTGEVGQQLLARNHALAIGSQSVIGRVTSAGEPVIARSGDDGGVHRRNELLPDTRAELAVPIMLGNRVIGALDVQSTDEGAFNEDDIAVLQTLADQLAVAINNAQLFDQVEQALDETSRLFRATRRLTSATTLNDVYEAIISSLRHPPIDGVTVMLLDDPMALPAQRSVSVVARADRNEQTTNTELTHISAANFVLFASPVMDEPLIINDLAAPSSQIDAVSAAALTRVGYKSVIFVPMRLGLQIIGWVVNTVSSEKHEFTTAEVGLARATAEQAATVFERLRLLQVSQQRAQQEAAVARIGQMLTGDLSREALIEQFNTTEMGDLLRTLVPFEGASLALTRPDLDVAEMVALIGQGGQPGQASYEIPLEGSLLGRAILTGEPVRYDWQTGQENFFEQSLFEGVRLHHSLVLPFERGQVATGSFNLGRVDNQPFTEAEMGRLAPVVTQIAIAFQNARLFTETQNRLADMQQLRETFLDLSAQTNFDELMRLMASRAASLVDADSSAFYFYDSDHNDLVQSLAYNLPESLQGHRVPIGRGVAGTVAESRQHFLVNDYAAWGNQAPGLTDISIFAVLGVPLLWRDRLIGVLNVVNVTKRQKFSEDDVRRLSLFADQAALAIENARLLAETERALSYSQALAELAADLNRADNRTDVGKSLRSVVKVLGIGSSSLAFTHKLPDGSELIETIVSVASPEGVQVLVLPPRLAEQAEQEGLAIDPNGELIQFADILETPLPPAVQGPLTANGLRAFAYMPILSRGNVIARLALAAREPRLYTEAEQRLLRAITEQLSVTIENLRLQEVTSHRAQQLAAAAEVSRGTAALRNPTELMNRAVDLIRERFGFYHAQVFLLDEVQQWAVLVASTGAAGRELLGRNHRLEVGSQSVIGYVTSKGEHLLAIAGGPIHRRNPLLPDTQAELALPMVIGNRVIGALDVQSTQADAFKDDDIELLQTMANQLAVAVENANLFSQTRQALQETQRLYEVNNELVLTNSPSEVASVVMRALREIEPGLVVVLEAQEDTQAYRVLGLDGPLLRAAAEGSALQAFQVGVVVDASNPLWLSFDQLERVWAIQDVATDTTLDKALQANLQAFGLNSMVIEPMRSGNRLLGVIFAGYETTHTFSPNDLRWIDTVADEAAVILQNQRLLEATQRNLDETAALYQVGSAILGSTTLDEINRAVVEHIMPEDVTDCSILAFDLSPDQRLMAATILANFNANLDEYQSIVGRRYTASDFPGWGNIDVQEPIIIESMEDEAILDQPTRRGYQRLGIEAMVMLPLRVRGQLYGGLQFSWSQPRRMLAEEVRRWSAVADQVAVAVQNLDLLAETQTALEETERLYLASRDLSNASTTQGFIRAMVGYFHPGSVMMGLLVNYGPINEEGVPHWLDMVAGWRRDGRQHTFVSPRYLADDPAAGSMYDLMVTTSVRVIPDALALTTLPPRVIQTYVEAMGVRSLIVAPIIFGEDRLGAILLLSDVPNAFRDEDLRAIQTLAQQAGLAYQNQQLLATTQRSLQEAQTLYRASNRLTTATSVDDIQEAVLDLVTPLQAQSSNLILFPQPVAPDETPTRIRIAAESRFDNGPSRVGQEWNWTDLPATMTMMVTPDRELYLPDLGALPQLSSGDLNSLNLLSAQTQALLIIPLRTSQRWMGFFVIAWDKPQHLQDEGLRPFRTIAEQAATVLDNRFLFEEAQAQTRQIQALFEASQFTSRLDQGLEAGLHSLFRTVAQNSSFSDWWVMLNDPTTGVGQMISERESDDGVLSRTLSDFEIENSLMGMVLQSRQPIVIENLEHDTRADLLDPVERARLGSLVIHPMVIGDQVLGVIGLASERHSPPVGTRDIQLAQTLAAQLSVAVQNVRLFQETQRALAETQALYQVNRELNQANNFEEILEATLPVTNTLGLDTTNLLLFDAPVMPGTMPGQMRFVASVLPDGRTRALDGTIYDLRTLPFSRYLNPDTPIVFSDISTDRRLTPFERDILLGWHARSLVLVPLRVGSRWLGWISLSSRKNHRIDESRLRLVSTVADQTAAVLENRLLFEAAQRRARRELLINQITAKLRRSLDPETIARIGAEELSRAMEGASTSVWIDPGSRKDSGNGGDGSNGHN